MIIPMMQQAVVTMLVTMATAVGMLVTIAISVTWEQVLLPPLSC